MEETVIDHPKDKENDLFYFETDHLALRGNKHYSELLKTLFILTAQRERAFKDYEIIRKIQKEALDDPETFLDKLKKDELNIPPMQTIAQIPYIDWYKYNTKVPEEELKAIYSDKCIEKKETIDLAKHGNKSTHKKLWTSEEQKRLEELLIKFPPEPIESRRHRKIAEALGNRTEQQVSSRLQKYFQKMAKAGIPVHGKVSKSTTFQRKKAHKYNMWKPTTFFPEYNVSVYMDESETVPGPSFQESSKPSTSNTSNYLLSTEYHQPENNEQRIFEKTDVELQADLLRRVKLEKAKETETPYRHLTYKCNYCNEEPILGTRWHCSTCIQDSINFCTDCIISQIYSETPHPLNHKYVTLPHSDDPNPDTFSESESESANDNSNNMSDSDASAYSSAPSLKFKRSMLSNGNSNGKNGKIGVSISETSKKMDMDKFLNNFVYEDDGDKTIDDCSTSDMGYAYLRSNLSMDD